MSLFKISESIRETVNKLIDLLNAHLDYYQIVAFDKIISILSKLVSSAIISFTLFMVLFFGSFALAVWMGEMFQNPALGFLATGVLYGILGWVLWLNRVNWIINPMIAALTETIEETTIDLGLDDPEEKKNNPWLKEEYIRFRK